MVRRPINSKDGCKSYRLTDQARPDALPIDVGHEVLDVLRALGGLEIHGEGVLPEVHDEDRREAGGMPDVMVADPMHRERGGDGILKENRPADATGLGDRGELFL